MCKPNVTFNYDLRYIFSDQFACSNAVPCGSKWLIKNVIFSQTAWVFFCISTTVAVLLQMELNKPTRAGPGPSPSQSRGKGDATRSGARKFPQKAQRRRGGNGRTAGEFAETEAAVSNFLWRLSGGGFLYLYTGWRGGVANGSDVEDENCVFERVLGCMKDFQKIFLKSLEKFFG